MRIDQYFAQISGVVAGCLWVQSSNIAFDQRSTFQGYIRGELFFTDGSVLHLREYVDTESVIERFVYAYQYMDAARKLVFRYDNAGHHQRLNLSTFPHHKHDGSERNIVAANPPDLTSVLAEIETYINLSA